MKDNNEPGKLSPLMRCKASNSSVMKYMRVASTCADVKHIGNINHSTRARDIAIRSFRGVCTFIAVVLASQSYPDPAWLGLESATSKSKKDPFDRDIESLFPYPVKWTHPSLILNTDETTLVLTKHKKKARTPYSKWRSPKKILVRFFSTRSKLFLSSGAPPRCMIMYDYV